MKIFKTFLLLTLLYIPEIYAQNYNVKWGPLMPPSRTDIMEGFVYADQDHVTVLKKNLRTKKISGIEKYNSDFKLMYFRELIFEDKNIESIDASFTGKKILNFYSIYNPKAKTLSYKIQTMDDAANSELSELDIATVDKSNNNIYYTIFGYNSPDYKNKVYVIENRVWNKKDDHDKEYVIVVVGEDGNKLWQKTITNKGVSIGMSTITELAVNKNGDVVVVESRVSSDSKTSNFSIMMGNNILYDINLYMFTNNGTEYKKINVTSGNFNSTSCGVEVNQENDNFQFAGMYSNGNRGVIQGVFTGEIDKSGAIVKSNQKDFSDSFLDSFEKFTTAKEKGDKNEGLSPEFQFRRYLTREDGGGYIIFEYFRKSVGTSTSGNTGTNYIFNDIIVTSVDPSGKMDWNFRIPKNQESTHQTHSSFVPFINGNKLGLIYNENPKNLDLKFNEKFKKLDLRESVAVVRTLDPTGKLSTDILFKNKDFKIMVEPGMWKQTSPSTIAIYGGPYGLTYYKNARLGTVEINK